MFKFKLQELMEQRHAKDGAAASLSELARATGIHRVTLSKIWNGHPYNASLEVVGQLCEYFGCRIEDVVEYAPEHRAAGRGAAKLKGSGPANRRSPQRKQ